MRQTILDRVLTEAELTARMRTLATGQIAEVGKRTLYQLLQVDPSADPEVIEAAFRRLAMKYHPDTSTDPEASTRMREILEARECLTDPERRLAYDRSIGIARRPPGLRAEDI
jgi:curved DNA-binding protein CbpA